MPASRSLTSQQMQGHQGNTTNRKRVAGCGRLMSLKGTQNTLLKGTNEKNQRHEGRALQFLQFLMSFEPRVLQTGEYCLGWPGPWSSISIPAKLGWGRNKKRRECLRSFPARQQNLSYTLCSMPWDHGMTNIVERYWNVLKGIERVERCWNHDI